MFQLCKKRINYTIFISSYWNRKNRLSGNIEIYCLYIQFLPIYSGVACCKFGIINQITTNKINL